MPTKRILAVKNRNKKWLRFFLLVLLALTGLFFVKMRKDFLLEEAQKAFQTFLSQESDYEIRIGRVSGRLTGQVRLENVEVLNPGPFPDRDRRLFSAKEIIFHYRFLDFLSKKSSSGISVTVQSPRIVCQPKFRLRRRMNFPFFNWMRQWLLTQKDAIDIQVLDMGLEFERPALKLEGIKLRYGANQLEAEIPLRHLTLGNADLSTVLKLQGKFRLGYFGAEDVIEGEISTEGTVVNWTPLPEESSFRFVFSRSEFSLISSNILGGLEAEGGIRFDGDTPIRWRITAENYPIGQLEFVSLGIPKDILSSRLHLDLKLEGTPEAPLMEGQARIVSGAKEDRAYKAIDLQVRGVYPTVTLENSRLLLKDDSVMKFADKTLEFHELFQRETYTRLIAEAQQDTVVWGDWQFRRPQNIVDNSEFLLQRSLGDRAHLNFRDTRRDETTAQNQDTDKMQIGLEYRLLGKNSFKVEVDEDERFVGVEQKLKF